MSRHWTEQLDPTKHRDLMRSKNIGGLPVEPPHDRLIESEVYFVEVCSFRFEFVSVSQLREALAYFRQKHHGSSRLPDVPMEHYWQQWFERLPCRLFRESSRKQVVSALEKALATFESDQR